MYLPVPLDHVRQLLIVYEPGGCSRVWGDPLTNVGLPETLFPTIPKAQLPACPRLCQPLLPLIRHPQKNSLGTWLLSVPADRGVPGKGMWWDWHPLSLTQLIHNVCNLLKSMAKQPQGEGKAGVVSPVESFSFTRRKSSRDCFTAM